MEIRAKLYAANFPTRHGRNIGALSVLWRPQLKLEGNPGAENGSGPTPEFNGFGDAEVKTAAAITTRIKIFQSYVRYQATCGGGTARPVFGSLGLGSNQRPDG